MTTVPALAHQRCFNHARREAVARCPGCRRTFCRECITEHEDRVLCAACLRSGTGPSGAPTRRSGVAAACSQAALGLLVAWLFFFALGRALIAVPGPVHEGTLWADIVGGKE